MRGKSKGNGGLGRRGKFKHVESDATEGVNRSWRWSVVALKKRRDSRVDAVLELRPSALTRDTNRSPRRSDAIRALRGGEILSIL